MNALEVTGLCKKYPKFTLDNVSFSVGEGRVCGLIGRNGAGKSTTLKAIMRLIAAEGRVKVFGRDFAAEEATVKSDIGFVGGGFGFYPLKKIKAVSRAFASFYPSWNETAYRKYLSDFGIDEEKKPSELSEGMKVKYSLALALSHGARLLVMDEPTSGLDPLSREEFCDIVLELARENGVSVLFSTHITSDLMRVADDVVYISEGRVLTESPLAGLLGAYDKVTFASAADAARCGGVIGLKTVKEGAEGLVRRGCAAEGALRCENADLDAVMIHLETEKKGVRHAETH